MNSAGNGTPAVGDRDGDGVPDAEGARDVGNGFVTGVCGNSIDDDIGDFDGSTVAGDAPGEIDGSPDDGCPIPLSTRQTCREIADDDVTGPGEDANDRLFIDVTVGGQPGAGGGVPPDRDLFAFQVALNWSVDVVDASSPNPYFLINSAGAGQIYTIIFGPAGPPSAGIQLAVTDGSSYHESGPGVLGRITLAGNAAGFAQLTLSDVNFEPAGPPLIYDHFNEEILIGVINGAQIAVSKDGPDAGTAIGDSTGELFTCDDHDADGIPNASDSCPTEPEDLDDFQDEDGCPDDNDGDGISDNADACPQDPGVPERMGCPVPAVGGVAGLLDSAAPDSEAARLPSEDERGGHGLTLALAGISAALLAGSGIAVSLRRRL